MALPVWTADANHFTVDDNVQHTADGWHDHTVVIEEEFGGANTPYPIILTKELREDDELILRFAKEYMKYVH